jgi:Cu(I)/Ag(I) efflux system membrane fusion protein
LTAESSGTEALPPPSEHAAHERSPVELDPTRLQAMGVRTEPAKWETVSRTARAVATVVTDESRLSHVHTRVAGWIEELYVETTGQFVRAGEPLAGIFSQELLSSQTEYLSALRAAGSGPPSAVPEAARTRLAVLGMTEEEIRAVEERKEPMRLVTVEAPRSGVVLHRGVSVGTAVDPSTEIVTIADLTQVWVLAEVPESDIAEIAPGMTARLDFPSSGRRPFPARAAFLYPTLTERTRTLRVRFVVDNPRGSLRPGLYGTAEFEVAPRRVLTVPRDAVVDTGLEQHVFVAIGSGGFTPRKVELGVRLDERMEITQGLAEGEEIVSSGVFLIDSESRLRASGGMGAGHAGHGTPEPEPGGTTSVHEHEEHRD